MENGIILLDKKAGSSSRDLDNLLEKKFQTKKVGHLGTLDPFATGLMVVAVNKGTKFLPYLDDSRKSYIATLHLGASSSTLDPEGVISAGEAIPPLDKTKIAETMALFLGKSSQIPPMTSAVKIGGEELYKKAHRGEEVERKPREIEVFSFNLVEYKEPDLVFSVSVSRGTYIRVLGRRFGGETRDERLSDEFTADRLREFLSCRRENDRRGPRKRYPRSDDLHHDDETYRDRRIGGRESQKRPGDAPRRGLWREGSSLAPWRRFGGLSSFQRRLLSS
jgi:tRNA pseudouridine(55) synthase